MLYSGQSAYNGHAFVVDGYDGDQLFHVDWGWGGPQGYYLLDILNPDDKEGYMLKVQKNHILMNNMLSSTLFLLVKKPILIMNMI